MKSPYGSHLKKHVLQLGRDAYIHPDDPFYIDKVMRYKQESPEVHYRMGLEHERQGRYSRALFHYIEAIRVDSDYHAQAKEALLRLEKKFNGKNAGKTSHNIMHSTAAGFSLSWIMIIILAIFNLIFISLLLIEVY